MADQNQKPDHSTELALSQAVDLLEVLESAALGEEIQTPREALATQAKTVRNLIGRAQVQLGLAQAPGEQPKS